MARFNGELLVSAPLLLAAMLACALPAAAADLYAAPEQGQPPANAWQFSFTPYAWATAINGNATARGHTADVDESFIDIVQKSDSLIALMGFFEARKGPLGFFTDAVWADLTFDGSEHVAGSPFQRLPNLKIKANLNAELHHQQTIVQSGIAYEVARRQGMQGAFTALDLLGSARYWNESTDITLNVSGVATLNLPTIGLQVQRSGSRAIAKSGTLEWVDPVVGMRLRHHLASGSDFNLIADIGGFGAGSDFSWQVVGTYGFDAMCFGTPVRTVLGYRALAVDFSENERFGNRGLDVVQYGPVMGVSFRW